MIALLLACADPPLHVLPDTAPPVDSEAPQVWSELEAPRLWRRMHLDLTGELPDPDSLDAVALDPGALDAQRDALLDDPRLQDRLVVLLGEQWLTQIDEFLYEYEEHADYYQAGVPEYAWERSVANESLHLMAHVVVEDRSWTEIVTSDTTMANELLGGAWPLDYPAGETGWREVAYTDGRPGAGILSGNGLWLRYYTTPTNYNRGRAAMLSDQLVCESFVSRPVDLAEAPSLATGEDIQEAIRTVPYCQGCHASLDPIAAALFGFWTADPHSRTEHETYHPEREAQGEELMEVEMAWFGQPVGGLEDLGLAIAQDGRFDTCTVQNWTELLWRRTVEVDDGERLEDLRGAFLGADRRVKPLLAAIQDTPEYREPVVHQMPPQLLHTAVEGLTGFRWEHEGFDQLDNSILGYRTLGGGVDGE